MSFVKIWSQFYSLLHKKGLWIFIHSKGIFDDFVLILKGGNHLFFDKGNLFNGLFRSQWKLLHSLGQLSKGSIVVVYVPAWC